MPIIKSAKKKVRVTKRNYTQNLKYKEKIKKTIKAYYAVKDDKKKAKKLAAAYSAIDKAAKVNVIHKNKAARLKADLIKNPERKIKRLKRNKKTSKAKRNRKK